MAAVSLPASPKRRSRASTRASAISRSVPARPPGSTTPSQLSKSISSKLLSARMGICLLLGTSLSSVSETVTQSIRARRSRSTGVIASASSKPSASSKATLIIMIPPVFFLYCSRDRGRPQGKKKTGRVPKTECSLFFKSVSCQHYKDDELPVQRSGYYASGWPASELDLLQRVKVPITPMGAAHLLIYVYHNCKVMSRTFCKLCLFFMGSTPPENSKSDESGRKAASDTKYWGSSQEEPQYP